MTTTRIVGGRGNVLPLPSELLPLLWVVSTAASSAHSIALLCLLLLLWWIAVVPIRNAP